MDQRHPKSNNLRGAVDTAVRSTDALLRKVEDELSATLTSLEHVAGSSPDAKELTDAIRATIATHREDAGSFRVVLFGRTGAGKSSIIEALSAGDGSSISTGVSDFTTKSRPVNWGPLQLIDTPGIAGWGRTQSVESLESEAAAMVARADLVVLAFDTQNQQTAEFELVGRLIADYGRPCIAMLNVRNPRWRDGGGTQEILRKTDRTIVAQAAFIGRSLADLGLVAVPVVPVHAQKASEALCATQYAGPRAEGVDRRRQRLGVDRLRQESNVDHLIAGLSQVLEAAAPQLRSQALRGEILGHIEESLSKMRAHNTSLTENIDASIEAASAVAAVIGTGATDAASTVAGSWERRRMSEHVGLDAILAVAGDRPILESPSGSVQQLLDDLARINLWPVQRRLRDRCDELALKALSAKAPKSSEGLKADLSADISALHAAAEETVEALARETEQQLQGLSLTLEYQQLAWSPSDFLIGGKQSSKDHTFLASAEMALAAISAIGAFFGPVGWAVSVVSAIAGFFVSKKTKKSAAKMEARQAQARGSAIKDARKFADQLGESVEQEISSRVSELTLRISQDVLGPFIRSVAVHNTDRVRVRHVTSILEAGGLAPTTEGSDAIRRVMSAVGRQSAHRISGAGHTATRPTVDYEPMVADDLMRRARAARADFFTRLGPNESSQPRDLVVAVISNDTKYGRSLAKDLRCQLSSGSRVSVVTNLEDLHRFDAILWLLEPNPGRALLSWLRDLRAIDEAGAKLVLARSLFAVGRLEELGPDPAFEPDELIRTMDRKGTELSDLLSTAQVRRHRDVHSFVWTDSSSSDLWPHGYPHDHYGAPFGGDAGEVLRAIRSVHLSVVEANRRVVRSETAKMRLSAELDQMGAVMSVSTQAVADWKRLSADSESRLRRTVGDIVDGLAVDVVEASSADQLQRRLKKLNDWPDGEVASVISAWEQELVEAVDQMNDSAARSLSEALAGAGAMAGNEFEEVSTRRFARGGTATTRLGQGAKFLSDRDRYYKAVKIASRGKFKFKPWGAIKGAKAMGKVSVALAVVAAAITAADLAAAKRARDKRAKLQAKVLRESRRAVRDGLDLYLRGRTTDENGPIKVLEDEIEALVRHVDQLERDRHAIQRKVVAAESRIKVAADHRNQIEVPEYD